MSIKYLMEWKVGSRTLGIEDQEQKGDHFFPHEYRDGKRGRYGVWIGGCGVGNFDTLDAALERAKLMAVQEVERNRRMARELSDTADQWAALF